MSAVRQMMRQLVERRPAEPSSTEQCQCVDAPAPARAPRCPAPVTHDLLATRSCEHGELLPVVRACEIHASALAAATGLITCNCGAPVTIVASVRDGGAR